MFAPIFIGVGFALGIFAMYQFMFLPDVKAQQSFTYQDCVALKDSHILESYPPVCVTAEGMRYTKDLPKVLE